MIKINDKVKIGKNAPVFFIAEAGINHNGDYQIAKKMIDVAIDCGADAIKFQTFKAEEFVSNEKETYTYFSQGIEKTESMLQMFKRNEFTEEEWKSIFEYANERGIIIFTTPQNLSDLEMMSSIVDLPIIKVGADDLTNLELLRSYAKYGKPMIISTGMAYISEIEDAVRTIRNEGLNDLVVLHCVSSYPASADEIHMKKMKTIETAFEVEIGFSDHSIGSTAAVLATALGAKVIEKHFTLDKNYEGPDHWFSSDPSELKQLITSIRESEEMLGNGIIEPTYKELETRKLCRRSIVARYNIEKGDVITREKLDFKRPGTGLPPKYADWIINKRAKSAIKKNNLVTLKDCE